VADSALSKQLSRHIFWGLVVGAALGVFLAEGVADARRDWITTNVLGPIGQLFLRGLFLVVVPLVFSSLAAGVAGLGSTGALGRMGARLMVYYVATTLVAVAIGQTLVLLFRPGASIGPETAQALREKMSSQVASLMESSASVPESLWPGLVSTVVPKNVLQAMANGEMLAIIFVAVLFGAAIARGHGTRVEPLLRVLEAVSDASVRIVGWVLRLAPVAVAALVASAVAQFGTDVLRNVALYVGVVVAGYVAQLGVTYSILVWVLARCSPLRFFRNAGPVLATAFGTSSSNATLPTTIRVLEERFAVPPTVTRFSVPLGATVNMDGTALFEIVAAIFVAQVFGVELSLGAHLSLVFLVLVTSIGVAGVPGGSVPILMSAMHMVGIPPEGIALVLGVDRFLDMGRTVVNVTGDMVGALYVARKEGAPLSLDG
jgi:DAACS family dicarboxylate/amino acid:cation (Na+ or H+) symporter